MLYGTRCLQQDRGSNIWLTKVVRVKPRDPAAEPYGVPCKYNTLSSPLLSKHFSVFVQDINVRVYNVARAGLDAVHISLHLIRTSFPCVITSCSFSSSSGRTGLVVVRIKLGWYSYFHQFANGKTEAQLV